MFLHLAVATVAMLPTRMWRLNSWAFRCQVARSTCDGDDCWLGFLTKLFQSSQSKFRDFAHNSMRELKPFKNLLHKSDRDQHDNLNFLSNFDPDTNPGACCKGLETSDIIPEHSSSDVAECTAKVLDDLENGQMTFSRLMYVLSGRCKHHRALTMDLAKRLSRSVDGYTRVVIMLCEQFSVRGVWHMHSEDCAASHHSKKWKHEMSGDKDGKGHGKGKGHADVNTERGPKLASSFGNNSGKGDEHRERDEASLKTLKAFTGICDTDGPEASIQKLIDLWCWIQYEM